MSVYLPSEQQAMIKLRILKFLKKHFGMFSQGLDEQLNFYSTSLVIDSLDSGGKHYQSSKTFEEINSRLYDLIYLDYKPKTVIDVGANYGLISIIASTKIRPERLISIEASSKLIPYITKNLIQNSVDNYELIHAICSDVSEESSVFSINPNTSQDNRVTGATNKWKMENVISVSIDHLIGDEIDQSIFIKIDTQGFEEKVLSGAENLLSSGNNWIIKSEFSPFLLNAQGTNAKTFLLSLVDKFEVVELPATIPYLTKSINELFQHSLLKSDVESFISHIVKSNANDFGWVDLLIRPKKRNA